MGELGAFCVIKPHPLSRVPEPVNMDNLAVVTTTSISQLGSSLYELLAHADLLVTDHSSVWVDFLLTGRPIVFAISDLRDYADTRGFYFPDVERLLPGPLVTHVDQLGAAVADLVAGRDDWSAALRRPAPPSPAPRRAQRRRVADLDHRAGPGRTVGAAGVDGAEGAWTRRSGRTRNPRTEASERSGTAGRSGHALERALGCGEGC